MTIEINRQNYMDGKVTFTEFYRAVYKAAGIQITDQNLLERVRHALVHGDEHLNTIPLGLWDNFSSRNQGPLQAAFKQHGDHYSLGGGVCAFKQAARDAVNGEGN